MSGPGRSSVNCTAALKSTRSRQRSSPKADLCFRRKQSPNQRWCRPIGAGAEQAASLELHSERLDQAPAVVCAALLDEGTRLSSLAHLSPHTASRAKLHKYSHSRSGDYIIGRLETLLMNARAATTSARLVVEP